MLKEKLKTDLKFCIFILSFILIIYPVKRFIYPSLKFILDNAYMIGFLLVVYAGLYLYDFNASRILNDLLTKLLSNNLDAMFWFFTPLISIGTVGFTYTSPAGIIIDILAALLLYKIIQLILLLFDKIKQTFGDVLLVILWCYYRLAGKKEESVMLINSDEAKNKMAIYATMGIVIILTICIIFLPQLLQLFVHSPMSANLSEPLIIENKSIDINMLSMVIP